ncbi:protein DpdG [Variovorax humicola]|uniref:Protein DpdG n=1 Tax=Variovorax humicola TaxID=1769758 RepID=A0ABU8WB88_9BURK
MTVLNITADGLPSVLLVLHHAVLASARPLDKTTLLDTVAPEHFVQDPKMTRQTLRRWTELGLFVESDEMISVADRPTDRMRGRDLDAWTRRTACRLALSESNNADLWAIEGARSADLTRSLAWMLAQDAYRTQSGDLEALEAQQIVNPDRQLLRNSTRKNGLRYWAEFLGFSRGPGGDIDPTVAVRDVVPDILPAGGGMPAVEFVGAVAAALPVLDGGRWQRAVLDEIDTSMLAPLQTGQLSTALSRALMCLRARGDLLLQSRADAGASITLTGFQGIRPDLSFQWIARPGKETSS